ncbi:MAG: SUMF1/EgtB/PvdO family nonheme iron enzyme [Gemmatimonadota bacterium]|nr:SUMF1/EgtB/PvdO family nonheme iron enzyme [Gemmatimonadota bacterium]
MDDQLLISALKGDLPAVRRLVDAGADVNTEGEVKGISDDKPRAAGSRGATPLVVAAIVGHGDVAEFLVDSGAKLNTLTAFGTPLMVAAAAGHVDIVRFLIDRGADVAVMSRAGNAVNYAARAGHPEVVRLLVDAGGFRPSTIAGIAAISAAKTKGHAKVAALLQAEFDEYLESGASADSIFKGVMKVLRKLAAKDRDSEFNRRLLQRMDREEGIVTRRKVGDRFRDCPECPQMIVLPTGEFEMGSASRKWEGPTHRVTIAEPIAMSSHEVTVAEFRRFVAQTGHSTGDSCWTFDISFDEILQIKKRDLTKSVLIGGGAVAREGRGWMNPGFRQGDRHPVVCVSWGDARAYAKWLSRKTGESYRLPSESEWEYAARAGTSTPTYWGNVDSADRCRHGNVGAAAPLGKGCRDGNSDSSPVGSYIPNAFGLFDMLGNAWEWTADCWNSTYRGAPDDGTAWTIGDCQLRAVRGGSYKDETLLPPASAVRKPIWQTGRTADMGFRVVRSMRMEMREDVVLSDEGQVRDSNLQAGVVFRDCANCPEMVVVPSGTFEMGSPRREKGRSRNEGPVRRVAIANRFAIGAHEVTRREFRDFVTDTAHPTGGTCSTWVFRTWIDVGDGWKNPGFIQHDSHPVVCVNVQDAEAYARWLSKKTGKDYRLPSEAEWEYSARGGSIAARHWQRSGAKRSKHWPWAGQCAYANGADQSLEDELFKNVKNKKGLQVATDISRSFASCEDWYEYTSPTGTYRPNNFGLHDMIGNVSEWTQDCWNRNHRRAPKRGEARTSGDCKDRVVRGGGYLSLPPELRSANRLRVRNSNRSATVGFRVARSLEENP